MGDAERKLAKIVRADIGDVYNGILGLVVEFSYGRSLGQCFTGYMLDAAMVVRFMRAVGVDRLSEAAGRSCWVTCTHNWIQKIEPLHEDEGRPFVVAEWQEWVERRMTPVSWYELTTGENPDDQGGA
jgi:hypothetical protein